MKIVSIIFPHQLFKSNTSLRQDIPIFLVEEFLFFRQYNFHKQKLVLHRASMKFYESYLKSKKFNVHYIDSTDKCSHISDLIAHLQKQKITQINITDTVDFLLQKRIETACKKYNIDLTVNPSPNFLNTLVDVNNYFDQKKKYFQTDFYTKQRIQRNILIENNNKPIGGKWTFDAENRLKFPKNEIVPVLNYPKPNEYIEEATSYVLNNFANNYGSINSPNLFAVTFEDSEQWLNDFLKNRFEKFGIYEDSIVAKEPVLYHSVLSPMLNIGLLLPQQILDAALLYASQYDIPLNSLEGFIRQIIGWREFIKIVYQREGVKQRTTNYWNFNKKIPQSFWTGTTGILPIDETIKKILATGYCHHIERLMVLGNFMLLCEFDPNEVYRWFMEMFIDAYDWVMVPNVYGMTQFADGGLMTTKPYISGSNYLMKMSNYEKGHWQPIWDGLFWRFMHVHRNFFLQNPRLGMLVGTFDKMSEEKKQAHLTMAEKYLTSLNEAAVS